MTFDAKHSYTKSAKMKDLSEVWRLNDQITEVNDLQPFPSLVISGLWVYDWKILGSQPITQTLHSLEMGMHLDRFHPPT